MIKMVKVLGFLFLMFAIVSCNKDNPSPDFKYNFYPLNLKKILIYNVDSTAVSSFAGTKTNFKFQIKDSVADIYTDATNRTAYRIERYKKQTNESVWKFQKIISRVLNTRNAEETIDNKTFVRLVFPPEIGTSWNGNSKNDFIEKEFSITEMYDTFLLKNLAFNNTLVTHFEEVNLIREDKETHTYAQGVGLIASDVRAVDVDISNQKVTNGFFYTMELIAYR